jgi:Xaa-Pro aminopeptidase
VRIEDDVLITREGRELLTGGLPCEPDVIESLVGTA